MESDNQIDVASSSFGTKVVYCSDEFFADSGRMLQSSEPVWIEDKYDINGKWMDGWESRRRRDGKNDFCFIRLGAESIINSFNIDTTHFTGNFAPGISVQGCSVPGGTTDDLVVDGTAVTEWFDLVTKESLEGDSKNLFNSASSKPITHLKITLLPDGGIARFRAYGEIWVDEKKYEINGTNVISKESGAKAIFANDEHFGSLSNVLEEHEPLSMADGWETRRRRKPGNDWGIIALSKPATAEEVFVDTKFFKGNFPDTFSISTSNSPDEDDKTLKENSKTWNKLIEGKKLKINQMHVFKGSDILHNDVFTHIRVDIYPDGGIARLKLIGKFT